MRWKIFVTYQYVQNFLENPEVKESWKSVYICQGYDQKSSVLVFETQVV